MKMYKYLATKMLTTALLRTGKKNKNTHTTQTNPKNKPYTANNLFFFFFYNRVKLCPDKATMHSSNRIRLSFLI